MSDGYSFHWEAGKPCSENNVQLVENSDFYVPCGGDFGDGDGRTGGMRSSVQKPTSWLSIKREIRPMFVSENTKGGTLTRLFLPTLSLFPRMFDEMPSVATHWNLALARTRSYVKELG
jgi:hypothetical protein